MASHSRWISSPPLRRMAPATPPPRIRSLFAALTMASVSISVKSPCWMTILSTSDFIVGSHSMPAMAPTLFYWQLLAAGIHICRGLLCGPGGPLEHIAAARRWAGTFRQACGEGTQGYGGEHRVRRDRQVRTGP